MKLIFLFETTVVVFFSRVQSLSRYFAAKETFLLLILLVTNLSQ